MSKNPTQTYKERLSTGALRPDPEQAAAVQALQHLHGRIMERQAAPAKKSWAFWKKDEFSGPRGVYLHGGVGRGKSMLMDMFYDTIPQSITAQRIHFHAFMIDVHEYFHARRKNSDESTGMDEAIPALAETIAQRASVLCFDEFHVTDVADAMILGRLFSALFEKGVIVVATSNWRPDRLYEGGLQRERFIPFIELLEERMRIVHLDSPHDYRSKFLQGKTTYFWPLGKGAQEQADDVFTKMTDGAPVGAEEIKVKGRPLQVCRMAKGVARFTFSQLCEQPRGAEDYLAITGRYHTVFLEGIPKMAYDRRNEAKRLMTLIDVLYEQSTKLVITAEAPADKLYYGHDHAFEFDRTISRLTEMQSEEYLKKVV